MTAPSICGFRTGSGIAVLSMLLSGSVGSTAAAETEASQAITTAASVNEPSTAWEEPSLFPGDVPESSNQGTRVRRARRNVETTEEVPGAENEVQGTISTSQSEFGMFASDERSQLGLESTRQRDLIMARLQENSNTQPYNIKLGRLPLRIGASFSAEYTDNSFRSGNSAEADFIMIPQLDISGSVKLSKNTSLTLGLGVGYVKYANRSENDRLLLTASLNPDSGISLDVKIGKFLISIYDKPTVPQFQADAVTQRDQSQYQQFQNTAGINVLWDVNSRTNMSFRYAHTNSFSLTSDESTTDGSTDSFLASLSTKLSDSLGVGVEAGATIMTYKGDTLNDGARYHVGPFINFELSRYLRVMTSFGYQLGEYDTSGNVEDSSSLGTYYGSITFTNSLNTKILHSLSLGREAQQGSVSNYTISTYIRYQLSWDLIRGVNLGISASYQDIEESGGLFAENFKSFSFGIHCGFELTKRIGITLGYNYTKRDASDNSRADNDSLDFDENRVTLHLGYAF